VTGLTGIAPAMIGVAVVAVLAGCGAGALATVRDGTPSSPSSPSSGTRTPSAAQLVRAARDAFASASSVHVTGTAVRGADAYVLDVRLAGEAGGTATVEASGRTVHVTRIGDVAYVGGDLAFWRSITGNEATARRMVGSYLRTGAGDPGFATFVRFTEPSTYAEVLPDPAEPGTPTRRTTIRGAPAVGVRTAAGATLYMAASGRPYPVRLDGLTTDQVVFLDFSEYGAPVTLRAPSTVGVAGRGPGS
jgi:hypothetical protein